MEELRPLLAVLGLAVVVVGLGLWIARLRGWRSAWWERFFAPGRRRDPRAAAGDTGAARSARAPRPPSSARSREPAADAASRTPVGRPGAGSDRQTLIDLDFLPLLNPEDAVDGATTPLDREFDVGDLGSIETGAAEERIRPSRSRGAPAPSTDGDAARSGPDRKPRRSGGRSASKPRRPAAGAGRPAAGAEEAEPDPPGEGQELLIALTILAPDGRDLAGSAIREALTAFDLRPDDHGMFHHYGNRRGPPHEPVFSVANVLDPGVFDLAAMDELATPGLCLFLRRPGPLPATVAFDLMLDVGRRLSRALEAVLCDDQRCRLTAQATQALRERVAHFALRHERGASDGG